MMSVAETLISLNLKNGQFLSRSGPFRAERNRYSSPPLTPRIQITQWRKSWLF